MKPWSCCLSYKDTILKANHSDIVWISQAFLLLLILQRYYFESESQLLAEGANIGDCCCLSYKDTILKANHSTYKICLYIHLLLLILQRYYFESESQRIIIIQQIEKCCCLSYKDTILKANHSNKQPMLIYKVAVAYPTKILF